MSGRSGSGDAVLPITSPFSRSLFDATIFVAALLVLKNRAYHSHLSIRRPPSAGGELITCRLIASLTLFQRGQHRKR